MVHRLHGRMTHLLALPATSRCLCLRLLAIMLLETDIHVLLNVSHVRQDVTDNTHLDRPTEEIELAHGGLFNRCLAANLETDPLPSAERIEQTFGIRLEFAFIMEVYHELLGSTALIGQRITHIEFLRIIGDEPIDETETHRR